PVFCSTVFISRRLVRCARFPYTTLFRSRHLGACTMPSVVLQRSKDYQDARGRFFSALGNDRHSAAGRFLRCHLPDVAVDQREERDRKSTRLNSSHVKISYAVFCLKKKKH